MSDEAASPISSAMSSAPQAALKTLQMSRAVRVCAGRIASPIPTIRGLSVTHQAIERLECIKRAVSNILAPRDPAVYLY
jgi:hypothetical protein